MSRRASSEEILDEVERNLTGKFNLSPEKASRRLNHMRSAFPNAVVKDYEDLIPAMTNDPKDRHVAAAAVRGGAALIVTANIRDFPPESLEQYDIEAVHPDDFLQDQFDLDPTVTVACLRQQRAAYTRPQFSFREFYLSLARTVPNFVSRAAPAENADWNPGDPMPLEMKSADEARQAFFPEGDPVPTNPLGAATLWWTALLGKENAEFDEALRNMTWHPPAWGDFGWALQRLSEAGMMQFVERCPDDDEIAYVKFMPNVDHPMRAFGQAPLDHARARRRPHNVDVPRMRPDRVRAADEHALQHPRRACDCTDLDQPRLIRPARGVKGTIAVPSARHQTPPGGGPTPLHALASGHGPGAATAAHDTAAHTGPLSPLAALGSR